MKTHRVFSSLIALAFVFALTCEAQIREEPGAAAAKAWSQFIGEQLAESLVSPNDEIKAIAMQQITYFAQFATKLDLTGTVSPLLDVYKSDDDEQYRVASVAALHAVGDERGMQQLRLGVATQSSRRVQVAALAALFDFYGPVTFERDQAMADIARKLIASAETSSPSIASNK